MGVESQPFAGVIRKLPLVTFRGIGHMGHIDGKRRKHSSLAHEIATFMTKTMTMGIFWVLHSAP